MSIIIYFNMQLAEVSVENCQRFFSTRVFKPFNFNYDIWATD